MPQPVSCRVHEVHRDGSLRPATWGFAGSPADGWDVTREGSRMLRLGPGYRLLAVSHCGICATDLARHHLPFPLPQVAGHEVVARDESGRRVVVEINASHAARGLAPADWCATCRAGMPTHCPERLVLGIHALCGGFSPFLLAPVDAVVPVPDALSGATATLVEPFAAALAAVRALDLRDGDRVLVLGPGRLGSLLVAALDAWRRRSGLRVGVLVAGRRPEGLARARALGADEIVSDADAADVAEVAIDATGQPDGLERALRLATREVHVKSTTGRETLGLRHLTELVVDEIALRPWSPGEPLPAHATTATAASPPRLATLSRLSGLRCTTPEESRRLPLGGADLGVAATSAEVDALLRPEAGVERGAVRPRGTILLVDGGPAGDLVARLRARNQRLASSRCGDFAAALELLVDPALATTLGDRMVTAVVPAERLPDGFAEAARGGKVIVAHPGSAL